MKRTSRLIRFLVLSMVLFIAVLPLAASADDALEATVRAYLIGDNSGASAAGAENLGKLEVRDFRRQAANGHAEDLV